MLKPKFGMLILLTSSIAFGADLAAPQSYPSKPIRIVTIEVGGGGDFASRLIAPELSSILGQPIIIDNRPANLAADVVAKSPPDGYTLLYFGTPVWIAPLLQNTTYDAMKDLTPLSFTVASPNIMVVHPSLPVKSVKELIALAKARPGQLNYAQAATGSGNHLAGELFKAMAGVQIVGIPYRGGGPAITDLMGGQVQLFFSGAATVAPFLKSGRLRALAVTTAQPSPLFPGLPTVAEAVPGYESTAKQGAWMPARIPEPILKGLNQDIVRILNQPEVKQKFINAGYDVIASSPEEFSARIKSEISLWGKVIKDAGIRVD